METVGRVRVFIGRDEMMEAHMWSDNHRTAPWR